MSVPETTLLYIYFVILKKEEFDSEVLIVCFWYVIGVIRK